MLTKDSHISAEELYNQLKNIKVGGTVCTFSLKKCEELVPLINEINDLKKEKNAVILVHSYVSPEILYGVGDYAGDSYALSKNAIETDADIIVFAAVRFMGETAKILNPNKQVLMPAKDAGCSLADSIDAQKVRELRKQFPDHTFVTYINTTAEVKAESDVCVTSGNIYDIVEKIPNDKIYFLPDKLMGENLINEMKVRGIKKDIQIYDGTCYVHEEYSSEQIFKIRTEYPSAKILSHPECNQDVIKNSDFVGSTAQMMDYMETAKANEFLMLTECGLSSRLQKEHPEKKLVGTCTLCKYMKSNTLENILRVLKKPESRDIISIPENVQAKAVESVNMMFHYTK